MSDFTFNYIFRNVINSSIKGNVKETPARRSLVSRRSLQPWSTNCFPALSSARAMGPGFLSPPWLLHVAPHASDVTALPFTNPVFHWAPENNERGSHLCKEQTWGSSQPPACSSVCGLVMHENALRAFTEGVSFMTFPPPCEIPITPWEMNTYRS